MRGSLVGALTLDLNGCRGMQSGESGEAGQPLDKLSTTPVFVCSSITNHANVTVITILTAVKLKVLLFLT